MFWFSFVFPVFYRFLKENYGYEAEVHTLVEKGKSLMERTIADQLRSFAYAFKRRATMIVHPCDAEDRNLYTSANNRTNYAIDRTGPTWSEFQHFIKL
jgi:hypothetical protein